MAIDPMLYQETTSLAREEKSFYPVRIPVAHWQLRHYISTPEPDLLYFASRNDIYCLNTTTKKRKHIATLPFEARCTASGFGFVCVGGEDCGHFAAIKLDGSPAVQSRMDIDAALPLDNWRQIQTANANGRRAVDVKVERIGEEIVNSISIHRIQDEEAHLDDIVAVLTNNDRTVRIYSLPSDVETTVLDLPFPMNHATISPDGRTLVAVGDVNLAYFYERDIRHAAPQIHKPHNRLNSASLDWTLTNVVKLHISEPAGTMCYFTTAWSPSGRLVAIGSEGGYITVLDIELLEDPDVDDQDAVVGVVAGSRPDITNPHPGAIRSMMFSPDSTDLLIWAEDQGRVCIGDLRTGLRTRQTINLDLKDEKLKLITYEEVPADDVVQPSPTVPMPLDELEQDVMRRYRSAGEDATPVNFASEYIAARRRRAQQTAEVASMRSQLQAVRDARDVDVDTLLHSVTRGTPPRGLTAREEQVLDSLRTARQREEARAGDGTPRTVIYTSADMFPDSSSRSNGTAGDASTLPISELLSSVQDSFPELSRTNATSSRPGSSHTNDTHSSMPSLISMGSGASQHQWAAAANSNLVRLSDGSRLPRRRASVILSPPATDPSSSASSTTRATTAAAAAAAEAEQNPWQTTDDHVSLVRGPLFASTRSRLQEGAARLPSDAAAAAASREADLQAELAAERARARSLARQRDRLRYLREDQIHAHMTAGAALGPNYPPSGWTQGNDILLRRAQMQMRVGGNWLQRDLGVRTAGLAMSSDGRVLWCACEEGIFEVEVGVKGRLFWPSVDPR